MSQILDLVQRSRLDAHITGSITQHVYHRTDRIQRSIRIEEVWRKAGNLGRGGFGEVYLEESIRGPKQGELRAVKKLHKSNTDVNRELFAIALFSDARYEHCFVQSFGWYELGSDIFIAMEYLQNGHLGKCFNSALPEEQVQSIVSQVLEGVDYMHDYRLAHRDLKPENILVVRQGPLWWVKLADFGISKRVGEDQGGLRTQVGTASFVAPEVLLSSKEEPYTIAVDLWSMGVITFLLLTGQTIFTNEWTVLEYAKGRTTLPLYHLSDKGVSDVGCGFVLSLLQAQPALRPTAREARGHQWLQKIYDVSHGNAEDWYGVADMRSQTFAHTAYNTSDVRSTASKAWSMHEPQISSFQAAYHGNGAPNMFNMPPEHQNTFDHQGVIHGASGNVSSLHQYMPVQSISAEESQQYAQRTFPMNFNTMSQPYNAHAANYMSSPTATTSSGNSSHSETNTPPLETGARRPPFAAHNDTFQRYVAQSQAAVRFAESPINLEPHRSRSEGPDIPRNDISNPAVSPRVPTYPSLNPRSDQRKLVGISTADDNDREALARTRDYDSVDATQSKQSMSPDSSLSGSLYGQALETHASSLSLADSKNFGNGHGTWAKSETTLQSSTADADDARSKGFSQSATSLPPHELTLLEAQEKLPERHQTDEDTTTKERSEGNIGSGGNEDDPVKAKSAHDDDDQGPFKDPSEDESILEKEHHDDDEEKKTVKGGNPQPARPDQVERSHQPPREKDSAVKSTTRPPPHWRVIKRIPAKKIPHDGMEECSVKFSACGQYMAASWANWDPGSCNVYETASWNKIATIDDVGTDVVFSPDSKLLAWFNPRSPEVWTWKLSTQKRGHTFEADTVLGEKTLGKMVDLGYQLPFTFSPSGHRLAIASKIGALSIWDVLSGRRHCLVQADGGSKLGGWARAALGGGFVTLMLTYSPTGRLIACGSRHYDILVRNAETGMICHRLQGHNSIIMDLRFSSDEKWLVSYSGAKVVKTWNLFTESATHETTVEHSTRLSGPAHGQFFATLTTVDGKAIVKKFSVMTGECTKFEAHAAGGLRLQYSQSGEIFATAGKDEKVNFWNSKNELQQSVNIGSEAKSLSFSSAGDLLAVVLADWSIEIATLRTRQTKEPSSSIHRKSLESVNSLMRDGQLSDMSMESPLLA